MEIIFSFESVTATMSSLRTNNQIGAVSGWIRQNYKHKIPEAIIKLCGGFYNQNIEMLWRGKKLEELLSLECGVAFRSHVITLTPDLSIVIVIEPNGKSEKHEGLFLVGIQLFKMEDNIESLEMYWEQSCDETMNYKRALKIDHMEVF